MPINQGYRLTKSMTIMVLLTEKSKQAIANATSVITMKRTNFKCLSENANSWKPNSASAGSIKTN